MKIDKNKETKSEASETSERSLN